MQAIYTDDFDVALKTARDTVLAEKDLCFIGFSEQRGWWVSSGNHLPGEPSLTVQLNGSVLPSWMDDEPDEEE